MPSSFLEIPKLPSSLLSEKLQFLIIGWNQLYLNTETEGNLQRLLDNFNRRAKNLNINMEVTYHLEVDGEVVE